MVLLSCASTLTVHPKRLSTLRSPLTSPSTSTLTTNVSLATVSKSFAAVDQRNRIVRDIHDERFSVDQAGKPPSHYCISTVSTSLSRTLSLPKRCRICGKMVYFRSFRCRTCNYVSHRQCADHNDHWFPSPVNHQGHRTDTPSAARKDHTHCNGTPIKIKANRPEVMSPPHADVTGRQRLHSDHCALPSRHPFHHHHHHHHLQQRQSRNLDLPLSPLRRDAAFDTTSSGSGTFDNDDASCDSGSTFNGSDSVHGSGFYRRLVRWLTSRKLPHETPIHHGCCQHEHFLQHHNLHPHLHIKDFDQHSSATPSIAANNNKLKESTADNNMARKRIKMMLTGAARRWSLQWHQLQRTPSFAKRGPSENCCSPHSSFVHRRKHSTCCQDVATATFSESTPTRCSCAMPLLLQRDSGISSLSSSVAQTPCSCETPVCPSDVAAVRHPVKNIHHHHQLQQQQQQWKGMLAPRDGQSPQLCVAHAPTLADVFAADRNAALGLTPAALRLAYAAANSSGSEALTSSSCLHHAVPVHATFPAVSALSGPADQHAPRLGGGSELNVAHTLHVFPESLKVGAGGHFGHFGRHHRCFPTKTRTLSLESKDGPHEDLCATWPPAGRKVFTNNDDVFEGSESGFEDFDIDDESNNMCTQSQTNIKDTLGEWHIPFKDLKIGRQMRRGRRHDIYRGRWHGEVMIHIFHINSEQETSQFWKEVASLSMIRHENVALFMGVCIDMPQLAIITSVRKGSSLYDHVHIKSDRIPLPGKVHIARQVAQGLSYLHAKGIVHRKLNSKNILLETKVKVCLLDQGMAEKEYDRDDYGCVVRGHLAYVSPEVMQSLRVEPPRVVPTVSYTKASDIFAFGTVLYELFGEQWPFQGQSAHSVIWQVASGHTQTLTPLKCSSAIKSLVSECWSTDVNARPSFHHILRTLQQNVLLHRRHSTSEPDNLNRIGFNRGGLMPC